MIPEPGKTHEERRKDKTGKDLSWDHQLSADKEREGVSLIYNAYFSIARSSHGFRGFNQTVIKGLREA